ncbi:ice-binding family protein [Glycomyces tritici]|uniref:Ice-binding family protein n=1 Tax=Glycomyces tritici TaxID=2665176 RepID=A0ABT7YIS8_9ACTN|nr:ice-binding family protein [Glycomyces tritici]MDN3238339.1 ice-binding family protein [Glycomyces tritici]
MDDVESAGRPSPSHPGSLGTAGNFSVLAGSTATNTGASTLEQKLGVHPGSTAPGFTAAMVPAGIHLADDVALQAKSDLTTAYNDAAGRTPFTIEDNELGGEVLTAGIYRVAAAEVTGTLTLDLQANPDAVFIFQIESTLITAPNSSVIFVNGASPCNVYWQVGSSATLGTGSDFVGNIMASASISMNTGADLEGRALAQTGAVTMDTNDITAPECAPDVPPTTTGGPTTDQPTTDQPTTDQPTTDQPTTDQPTTDQPTTDQPTTDQPTTDQPTTDQPTTDQPTTDQPTTDQPTTGGPSTGDATSARPSAGATTLDDDNGTGTGLIQTGNGALMFIIAAGLTLAIGGAMLAVFAWRRSQEERSHRPVRLRADRPSRVLPGRCRID